MRTAAIRASVSASVTPRVGAPPWPPQSRSVLYWKTLGSNCFLLTVGSLQNAVRRMSTEVTVRSQDAKAAGPLAWFFDLPTQNSPAELFPG